MSRKSESTADAEFKEAEKVVLNEKSKKEKSKKMKAKHIIEIAKTVFIVITLFVVTALGSYLYGHNAGYNERKADEAKVTAEAAALVETLKSSK